MQRPVRRAVATHTVPRSPVCFGVLHACGVLTEWKSAGRDVYGSRYAYGYPHSPYHSPGDHGHTPQLFHSRESPEDKYQRGNLISPSSGLRMDHVAHRHDERSRRDDRDIRRVNPTRPTWEVGDPFQQTERTQAQRAAALTPQSLPESLDSFLPDRERALLPEKSVMSGVGRSLGVVTSPRVRSSRGHPDAQAANSQVFPVLPVCDLVCVFARANLEKQATILI